MALTDTPLTTLNTATKYPSIPTHHALGDKGRLTQEATPFTGTVLLTEKIDGTNARILLDPTGDWIIGSREELLHARGDRIANPALGIADALTPVATRLTPPTTGITVYYLEVYGGKTTAAAREYTGHRAVGARLFDIADIPTEVLTWPREHISRWRDDGGQRYYDEPALTAAADRHALPVTPRLGEVAAEDLPASVEGMHQLLRDHLPATRAALDDDAGGRAEGIVLRTPDRSVITKARLQDYARTLKHRATPNR